MILIFYFLLHSIIKYIWNIYFSKVPLKTIIFSDNNNTWKSIVQNNNKNISTLVIRTNPKGQMMNRLWKHFALTLMPLYNMRYRMESEVTRLVYFFFITTVCHWEEIEISDVCDSIISPTDINFWISGRKDFWSIFLSHIFVVIHFLWNELSYW